MEQNLLEQYYIEAIGALLRFAGERDCVAPAAPDDSFRVQHVELRRRRRQPAVPATSRPRHSAPVPYTAPQPVSRRCYRQGAP